MQFLTTEKSTTQIFSPCQSFFAPYSRSSCFSLSTAHATFVILPKTTLATQRRLFSNAINLLTQKLKTKAGVIISSPLLVLSLFLTYLITSQDIKDSIELDFKVNGLLIDAYFLFQDSDQYMLPNKILYDGYFHINEHKKAISLKIPTDINGGRLAIGFYNSNSLNINAEIRYFINGGNCKC